MKLVQEDENKKVKKDKLGQKCEIKKAIKIKKRWWNKITE